MVYYDDATGTYQSDDGTPVDPATGQPLGAPPNSAWNGQGWTITQPGQDGYDPTWGGYTTGDPNGTSTGDQWLHSVYDTQGWTVPPAGGGTTGPTKPPPGGKDSNPDPKVLGPWNQTFSAPGFAALPNAPQFQAPAFQKGDPFTFKAPTADSIKNDPAYQFRTQQGLDAIQRVAASRGLLNDSGTLKSMQDYGQNAASQEFNNIWNRDWTSQLGTYNTNYQTQVLDPYAKTYQAALDTFAPRMQAWQTESANVMDQNRMRNSNAWNGYVNAQDLWKFNVLNALNG